MINNIIKVLENQNIELNHREVADAIWLALKMYEMEQTQNEQKSNFADNDQSPPNLSGLTANNDSNSNGVVSKKNQSQQTKAETNYKKEPLDTNVPLHMAKNQQASNNEQLSKSIPTKVPATKTLPKQLEIARALKPLLQKKDSKTEYIIDEEATARRIKEENIWFPVLRPKLIPRYNLELIIDISESIEIWQKTIAEFELLLKRHGAFGNVQSWLINTDKKNLPLSKKVSGLKQTTLRSYKELGSIGSEHLILIISDCVSSGWYGKDITQQINFWSKTNCVAILQVFPKTLWRHTSLGKRPIVEVETINNKVNAKLKTERTDFDFYQTDEQAKPKQPENVVVPIITFESVIMNSWASSLTGIPDFWVVGAKFLVGEPILNYREKPNLSPKQIVQLFYANASPTARKLATYLSLLPFDFSIVDITRKYLVKEAQQSHIAEILLSGLIRKVRIENDNGLSFIYDFLEGTREIIMDTNFDISAEIDDIDHIDDSDIETKIAQIQQERKKIINHITKYIIENKGSTKDFIGLIKSIKGILNTELSEPFANLNTKILKIVDSVYNRNNPNEFDIDNTFVLIEETNYKKLGIKSSYTIKIERNSILLPITNFIWSKNNSLLAIVGVGGYVTVVNTINKKDQWSKILKEEITAISWSPDDKQLALGTVKGTIYLLVAGTGEILKTLSEHQDKIYNVEWITRDKTNYQLVSCSADQTIRKWDSQTYEHKHTGKWSIFNLEAIAWTPNWDTLATICDNNQLKVWHSDAGVWHDYWTYNLYERATALCWNTDGRYLTFGLLNGDIGFTPWPKKEEGRNKLIFFRKHKERITSLAISTDDKILASKSLDNSLKLWSVDSQEVLLEVFSQTIKQSLFSSLAFHPQEPILSILNDSDGTLYLWDLDIEQLLENQKVTKLPEYNDLYRATAQEIRLKNMDTIEELLSKMSTLKELGEKISKLLNPTEFTEWKKENNRFIALLQRNYQDWNSWKSVNQNEIIDLSYQDLSKYNLNLNFVNLDNVNLKGANLRGIDLTQASINNADLSEAILIDTKLNSANLVNTKLVKAQLAGNNIFRGDFSGADFSQADLIGITLTEVKLNNAHFNKTKLIKATLENIDLSMADFDEAYWGNTQLWEVDLTTAKNLHTVKHENFSLLAFSSNPTPINTLPTNFLLYCCVVRYGKFEYQTVKLDKKGNIVERTKKQANQIVDDLGNGVTLEMVEIPAGEFMMGTSKSDVEKLKKECRKYGWSEDWIKTELPQHKVTIPTFFIGKYQVTQEQWKEIMGNNPSYFKGDGKLPVEQVSWNEAVEFCKTLSKKTNKIYRLPSEAEWEYACRAGTTTEFAFGETINTNIVNYNGNYPYGEAAKEGYRNRTIAVGSLGVANEFGIYGMDGNVWEWCQDYWHENYNGAPIDGSAWVWEINSNNNTYHILRGGSYVNVAYVCRSAFRDWYAPDRSLTLGFRVVCEIARTFK